ncbi:MULTISPECIES: hypothetical protein [Pedobacter]|uniref:hypothetical protein n=1 Tax=Pedobacter TaxID=84567 RepID=UPI00292F8ADB|nr:hypothetical protein [Pedobacter aquatilis]
MIISIDKNTPTSNLLNVKVGSIITDNILRGTVKDIQITDTDEFWLFIFYLEEGNQIEIKKIKNIC